MKVAIHQNKKTFDHSTSWSYPWIEYCEKNHIDYEVVNCYENGILEKLKQFDCLLWHFGNYVLQDMLFARSILKSAERMGLKVFPDDNTSWHFDDKVAQMYLLQSIGAPIPKFWVFYSCDEAQQWLERECKFPIIAKLRTGSGSNNVRLIKNHSEGLAYIKRSFSKGFSPKPSIFFKTKSNIQSSKNWEIFKKRFNRIPDFFQTMRNAKNFSNEKGYVFFQEFIFNDGFDIKLVVTGDKASYVCRRNRQNDFRASGSGDLFYDPSLISKNMINNSFNISKLLNFQCMGFDYLYDIKAKKEMILEMSYGFSYQSIQNAEGYWNSLADWVNKPINIPEEILSMLDL